MPAGWAGLAAKSRQQNSNVGIALTRGRLVKNPKRSELTPPWTLGDRVSFTFYAREADSELQKRYRDTMGMRGPRSNLTYLEPASDRSGPPRKPPSSLGDHGSRLWREMVREHNIDGAAGLAILRQVCEAADRAESLKARIAADGEVITTVDGGLKDHPALRHEQNARAFVVRGRAKLMGL